MSEKCGETITVLRTCEWPVTENGRCQHHQPYTDLQLVKHDAVKADLKTVLTVHFRLDCPHCDKGIAVRWEGEI